ncbi:MAG: EAL domain-containing protein [Aquificaceae bacterium]|nr:EAL domain-containing protein [Aquificaceae bacterium]
MISTTMGEECKKCSSLWHLEDAPAKLVFLVDNQILLEKLRGMLEALVEEYKEEKVVSLETESLKLFLTELHKRNILSPLEMENIWLVILQPGEAFKPSQVKGARSLSFWIALVACGDYLEALEKGRFITHFHPILDKNFSVVGYECLVRGIREDGTLIPPGFLFKCAENTDTVLYLDRLCRERAIRSCWEKGLSDRMLFINFVPISIYNPETCLRTTMEVVQKYGLKPGNIVFEVTESHKVEDLKHLKSILDYYRERGFKVALDDVSSGFSGLISLVNLKPDIIKIDIEIVRDVHKDYLKQEVINALVGMCNKNGIKVLAEGVETTEELEFLGEKVDLFQGFLFAKPSEEPPREVEKPKL